MSFGGWLAQEAQHTASQGALLWAARTECPPCTCKPSLACGAGQEALRLDCPAPAGAWPLSAVLLALVCGLGAGAALGRLFAPPAPTQTATRFERLEEEARRGCRASDSMSAAAVAAAGHPLATLGLDEGDFVLIRYQVGGARIWHERLLLAFKATAPFGTGILTPDGHGYVEAITTGDVDVADFSPAAAAPGGALAPMMVAAPAAGAPQAAVPAAGAAPAAAPWPPWLERPALLAWARAVWRTLSRRMQAVVLDPQGVRYIDFRAAAVRMHELPWADWPLKGPRTLLWVLNYICRNGGTPLGRHLKWKVEAYLDEEDPGAPGRLGLVASATFSHCPSRRLQLRAGWSLSAAAQLGAVVFVPIVKIARQRQAIMHIESSIRELGAPPPEFTDIRAAQDGAFRELLSCANLHGSGAASPSPYVRDRVAWPAGGAAPVDLIDLAQPQDRAWLEGWQSHMLRDRHAAEALAQSACPRGPYCDPGLVRDASIYGQFLIQMHQRQMVTFAADNGLPHSAPADGMHISTCDLECAFYHMRLPCRMETMFTLPSISAAMLQELGLIDLDFDPSTRATPMVTVLPMGFSWALHFCQSAARAVLAASGHERTMTALDGQPGAVVTDPVSVGVGAYVDNILAFGADRSAVDRAMARLAAAFRARGLPVHESEPAARDAEFLGLSLKHGRFLRIKPRNIWRLHAAISGLLRRGWCSGHMVRAVLGRATWSSTMRREAFTVPRSAYSFAAAHGERQGRIWASAAKELVTIRDLLPLLHCDLASGWHHTVTASDASPFGLGVMRRRAPRAVCAAVGRCSERWRFRVEGGHQARIRSLREGGLDQPSPASENAAPANCHSTSERLKPDVQHDSPAGLHSRPPPSGTSDARRDPQGQHGGPHGELMGQHVDPYEELTGKHEDPYDSMGQHGEPYDELMGFNEVLAQPPSGATRAHPDAVLGDPWEMDEVPGHITREGAWSSVSAQSVSTGANILYLEEEALVTSHRHQLRSLGAHGARLVALVDNLPLALACAKGRVRSQHLRSRLNQLCALSLATGPRLFVRWIAPETQLIPSAEGSSAGSTAIVSSVMRGLAMGAAVLAPLFTHPREARATPRRAGPTPSARTRHRAKLASAAARGRTLVGPMTLLEQLAARPTTEALYRQLLQTFIAHCSDRRRDWGNLSELDDLLAEYFTPRYISGAAASVGSQTVAALAHFTPGIPRQASSLLPVGVAEAPMAAWLTIAFSAYLRPAEAQRLTTDCISQPSAMADAHAFGDLVAQNFCLPVEKGFLGAKLQQLIPASLAAAVLSGPDSKPRRVRTRTQAMGISGLSTSEAARLATVLPYGVWDLICVCLACCTFGGQCLYLSSPAVKRLRRRAEGMLTDALARIGSDADPRKGMSGSALKYWDGFHTEARMRGSRPWDLQTPVVEPLRLALRAAAECGADIKLRVRGEAAMLQVLQRLLQNLLDWQEASEADMAETLDGAAAALRAVELQDPGGVQRVLEQVHAKIHRAALRELPQTPAEFHDVVADGDLEMCGWYLDRQQANPSALDPKTGLPPLVTAARAGDLAMCRLLLGHGADVDGRGAPDGCSALHWAAHQRSTRVATMLLEGGANPRLQDKRGQDALMKLVRRDFDGPAAGCAWTWEVLQDQRLAGPELRSVDVSDIESAMVAAEADADCVGFSIGQVGGRRWRRRRR
ncbi:unnamed protein product, partial [Prorocentrum cordatum]